jgi:hypothetical protein
MNSTWRDGVSKISIITATYSKWGSWLQPLISLKNFDFPVFAFLKLNLTELNSHAALGSLGRKIFTKIPERGRFRRNH